MKRNQIFEWHPNLVWIAGLAYTIIAIGCTRTPGADEDVFIIYGDRVGPDDRVQTNFDGEFSFYGMRTGDYTVYVYSEDTMPAFNNAPKVAIIRDLTITSRDEEYDLGTLRIFEDI